MGRAENQQYAGRHDTGVCQLGFVLLQYSRVLLRAAFARPNVSCRHCWSDCLSSVTRRAAGFISQLGRTGAFNVSVSAWVPCGILLTCLACTMGKDEDAMQVRSHTRMCV